MNRIVGNKSVEGKSLTSDKNKWKIQLFDKDLLKAFQNLQSSAQNASKSLSGFKSTLTMKDFEEKEEPIDLQPTQDERIRPAPIAAKRKVILED